MVNLKEVPSFSILTRNISLNFFLTSCQYVSTIPEKTACYRPFKNGHFFKGLYGENNGPSVLGKRREKHIFKL